MNDDEQLTARSLFDPTYNKRLQSKNPRKRLKAEAHALKSALDDW